MDSSPKPPAERLFQYEDTHEPMQATLAVMLQPDLGEGAEPLAEAWAWFLRAANRFQSGVFDLGDLTDPTPKQMGMGVSSLLLRSRELAARFRALDERATSLADALPPTTPEREKGLLLIERAVAHTVPHWPIPSWELEEGAWLEAKCRSVFGGCKAASLAMVGLEQGRRPWQDVLAIVLERFHQEAWTALAEGDESLLKGLPRVQEEITRLIYQEELASP